MEYDFDKIIERKNTKSIKWDKIETRFGNSAVMPMSIADMDFESPREVVKSLVNRAAHGVYGYSFNDEGYYESIINWYKKHFSYTIEKEWMINTPGVVQGLNLCVRTYTNEGDRIIVQTPVYSPFIKCVTNNKRQLVVNELNYENNIYTIDFDRFEKAAKGARMFILCSPHNPVGRVWTEKELMTLHEICSRNNILIISDEIHCDLVYEGYKHTCTASVPDYGENNIITLIAPSKSFNIPGLQASTAVISNRLLRNKFKQSLEQLGIHLTNIFALEGAQAAYRYGQEWLQQVLQYIRGNYEYIKGFLKENMLGIIHPQLEGTYLMWLNLRNLNISSMEIDKLFEKEAKIAGCNGLIFGRGGEGFYRINIATQRRNIEIAMDNIKNAVGKWQTGRYYSSNFQ